MWTTVGSAPIPISIYIDADACPVKAEIYRVAERYGFDAADDWIVERAGPGDIVVTADIPLADRSLKKGAAAIGSTGIAFTPSSIGMAMANRELMSNLRAMGEITGGPKPMGPRDRSRFLSTLDETVQKLRRIRP